MMNGIGALEVTFAHSTCRWGCDSRSGNSIAPVKVNIGCAALRVARKEAALAHVVRAFIPLVSAIEGPLHHGLIVLLRVTLRVVFGCGRGEALREGF